MSLNSFGNKLRTGPLGAILFVIVVLCVGVLAFTGLGQYVNNRQKDDTGPKPTSDVIATVDKTPITVSEFQNTLTQVKDQYASYGQPPSILEDAQIRYDAFSQLETPILMSELAKQHGLKVSSDEIAVEHNKQLSTIKSELSLPSSASESDVSAALATQGHSVSDFINDDGIKISLLANKYRDYLTQANQASEDTVINYYTQVHVRHILISNKKRPPAQAEALATDLIGRLKKGADFATLVKQYSDDPGTASKGGDDGFIDGSTPYVPEFKTAALVLKPGQITQSPVLSQQYGYFIIQALAVKSNLPKDYKAKHAQYVSQVTNALAQQQAETELAAAKAQAKVVPIDSRLKGDVLFATAQQTGSSIEPAIADYDDAIKNGDDADKADIYATEAEIYQQLGQPDKETAALLNATNSIEDPNLRLMLGDVYKQKGDVADALKQYKTADDNSYDNPTIHYQLVQDYKTLKQPDLVAQQTAWIKTYTARQKQASAGQTLPQ